MEDRQGCKKAKELIRAIKGQGASKVRKCLEDRQGWKMSRKSSEIRKEENDQELVRAGQGKKMPKSMVRVEKCQEA